ncbi:MAG: hypothetical protein ACI87W_000639 [Halieaceae bacterium]|jgi:hypothetical protein
MRRHALLLTSLLVVSTVCPAQDTREDALALITTYIERHNSHDLDGVMSLYAADAIFYLSMGRPPVHGRKAIEGLERFDVAARSTIYPQDVSIEQDAGLWRVHIGGAIEHSDIFATAGVSIVMAQGIRNAFVLRDSRIIEVHQPELEVACRDTVLAAFRGAVAWLIERNDPREEYLVENGFIKLTPATIPEVVTLLREWRISSGGAADPRAMSACANFKL